MTYPKQDFTSEILHAATLRALDRLHAKHRRVLNANWSRTRAEIQKDIAIAYRHVSPNGRWDFVRLKMSGMFDQLRMQTQNLLMQFQAISKANAKAAFKEIRRESGLRYAWMLSQLIPQSRNVRFPIHSTYREAARPVMGDWQDRWGTWIESYHSALLGNLKMGALNASTLGDAMDEVDATKVNTPSATLADALERLFDNQVYYQIAQGAQEIAELNAEVETEIWRTRGNVTVCDDCDANEGLPLEDADGEIPLHPNCNCFYQMVPKSFADLLASGDDADQALAEFMDARDIVPNSMLIRNEKGDVAGRVVVTFDRWLQGQSQAISGGVQ